MKKQGLSESEYQKAICINMEMPKTGGRHRLTKTYGRNMTDAEKIAYYNLTPLQALEFDIEDLRRIYRLDGLYDLNLESKLQEIITENISKYPSIFK